MYMHAHMYRKRNLRKLKTPSRPNKSNLKKKLIIPIKEKTEMSFVLLQYNYCEHQVNRDIMSLERTSIF